MSYFVAHCLKMTQNVSLEFFNFGIFSKPYSIYVNIARLARNVDWDFSVIFNYRVSYCVVMEFISSDFYRKNIVIRVAWMHFFGRKRLPLQDPNFRENPREDKGKLCPAIMSPLLYWSIVIQFNENKVFLTCTWRQNGFRHMICYSIFSEVLLFELLSLSQSFWPQVHFSLSFSTCFTALIIIAQSKAKHCTFHSGQNVQMKNETF